MKNLLSLFLLSLLLDPWASAATKTVLVRQEESIAETGIQKRATDPSSPVNGQIWLNTTEGKTKYFDGSATRAISGAGGAGGIVLNDNYDFESGSLGWSASGGVYTVTTTAANVAFGRGAGSWTPSASGQTLSYTPVAVPQGLLGKVGTASLYYKGGDANYVFEVTDGTNVIATSTALSASTTFTGKKIFAFTYPTSGSVAIRLRTTAAAPAQIFVDNFAIGQDLVTAPSPVGETLIGYAMLVGNGWSGSATAQGTDFAPVAAAVTISGDASQLSQLPTSLPGFRFTPKTLDTVRIAVSASMNTQNGATGYLYLTDGTYFSRERWRQSSNAANPTEPVTMEFLYTPTAIGVPVNLRLQSYATAGQTYIYSDSASPVIFNVYRLANQGQVDASQGLTVDQTGWRIDAALTTNPLANVSLGTATISAFTPINHPNLILSLGTGSAPAQVACSGTTDSTGTTCSGVDEHIGFSFSPPTAGANEVCINFNHYVNTSAGGTVDALFKIAETGNTSTAIVQEGLQIVGSGGSYSSGNNFSTFANKVCGVFNFADTSKRTIRLFYKQGATSANSSTVSLDNGNVVSITVRPRIEYANAIKFTNLVTTSRGLGLKTEAVYFAGANETSACTTTPCQIYTQTPAVQSVIRSGVGEYQIIWAPGTWTIKPICTPASDPASTLFISTYYRAVSTLTNSYILMYATGGASANGAASVICTGW